MKFSDEYMYFLNKGKTERECVAFAKKMLDENGFKDICEYENLKPGDKVYYINRDKSIYVAVVVFPFVPVSPIIFNELYALPKNSSATTTIAFLISSGFKNPSLSISPTGESIVDRKTIYAINNINAIVIIEI